MIASSATPLLTLTTNPRLTRSWQGLDAEQWQLEQGQQLDALHTWRAQGKRLVVVDAQLLEVPGASAAWRAWFQGLRVLVLSEQPNDEQGQRMLSAGASGYAHAMLPPSSLQAVLGSIEQGNIWLGRSLLQRLLQDIEQRLPAQTSQWHEGLTEREQEVARWAALGESNTDIAQRLGITERTVRAHLSAVFEKLHVSDRLKLALKVHGIQV